MCDAKKDVRGRRVKAAGKVTALGSLFALVACSGAAPQGHEPESVAETAAALLSTACTLSNGNLTLTVQPSEVAYLGFQSGCTTEPCVFANAVDSTGNVCWVASSGKTIAIAGGTTGTEKLVLDYTNGLFALATHTSTASPTTVTMPSGSTIEIQAPSTGGHMAAGANGLDINTLVAGNAGRGGAPTKADVSLPAKTTVIFNGSAASNVFTGDAAGWTCPGASCPAGLDTTANINTVVGAATALNLTLNGGIGNDTFAGGTGTNTLVGGPGDDTFLQSTAAHAETMQGGDGFDTVDYSARAAAVTVTVHAGSVHTFTATGGSGYKVGDVLNVSGGLTAATFKVTTAGVLATAGVTLSTAGAGYVTGGPLSVTDVTTPAATGGTITVTSVSCGRRRRRG